MAGRKIIQIAGATSGDSGNFHSILFALCADGSTWRCSIGSAWQRIADIPAETIDAEKSPASPPLEMPRWNERKQ